MLPYCEELIENERIVGRFGMGSNELIDDESWFQDPESLSDLELTKAISSLTFRIEQQKSLNDQAKKDLDILALAKQTLDLDVGFFLADLITEELDVIDDVGD
ncbi:hypothetical protein GPJ56_005941 [Histomonas meleagridis]|uniref:uncharacterized protein n=1 Tax=Histomonas meleagridis TaxID=135588 RepID=UPI0035599732|nr:hypothetical protein GPJ56_005941 [Histomonas meleagridis]KAH0803156.1 hypothetical protein GO595_004047 [Histomonas meleagridis]